MAKKACVGSLSFRTFVGEDGGGVCSNNYPNKEQRVAMKKWTAGALFAGVLVGVLSALVCGAEGIPVLMALGDRYQHDYEYFLGLWWLIPLISGAAGFYFPFAWLLRGGCRTEDLKFLLGAIGRIACSLLLAGIFLGGWAATADSITFLVPEAARPCWWAIYDVIPVVLTATGFAAGMWLVERLGGTRKTRFLRIFVWPLVGCVLGAGAIFCIGMLMFSLGTASLVLREVLAATGRIQPDEMGTVP